MFKSNPTDDTTGRQTGIPIFKLQEQLQQHNIRPCSVKLVRHTIGSLLASERSTPSPGLIIDTSPFEATTTDDDDDDVDVNNNDEREVCPAQPPVLSPNTDGATSSISTAATATSATVNASSDSEASPVAAATTASSSTNTSIAFLWQCNLCLVRCPKYAQMVKHAAAVHGIMYRYKCTVCKKRMSSQKVIAEHVDAKHPSIPMVPIMSFYHRDTSNNVGHTTAAATNKSGCNRNNGSTQKVPPKPTYRLLDPVVDLTNEDDDVQIIDNVETLLVLESDDEESDMSAAPNPPPPPAARVGNPTPATGERCPPEVHATTGGCSSTTASRPATERPTFRSYARRMSTCGAWPKPEPFVPTARRPLTPIVLNGHGQQRGQHMPVHVGANTGGLAPNKRIVRRDHRQKQALV